MDDGEALGLRNNQRVYKHTGDYHAYGNVRAVLTTKKGRVRIVVEHDNGMLHIYAPANLNKVFAGTGLPVTYVYQHGQMAEIEVHEGKTYEGWWDINATSWVDGALQPTGAWMVNVAGIDTWIEPTEPKSILLLPRLYERAKEEGVHTQGDIQ